MILARLQLVDLLVSAGFEESAFPDDALGANLFATVSPDWVSSIWDGYVRDLQAISPRLVEVRDLGAGRSRLVPRYILNGFCCRGAALGAYARGMTAFALQAANSLAPLDHDGLAFGFLHYTAVPRADNLNRVGRHEQLWGVSPDGKFFSFEDGDGQGEPLIREEIASATLVFAQ